MPKLRSIQFINPTYNQIQLTSNEKRSYKILQKKKRSVLETWMKYQLADEGLREVLMTNEDLRVESEELLNRFINTLKDDNIDES